MFSDTALIVGVDVHQHTNVTLVMDGCGDVVDNHHSFANNGSGTEQFARYLTRIATTGGFATIHIAAEATNNFWLPLFHQLESLPSLSKRPVTLYPFNPRLVHNFKKALGEEEKTDLRDAGTIAERLRFGKKLPRPFVMEEMYLPLRTLTRYRYHLVQELVRVKSYCLSLIYLKATDYTDKKKRPFSDTFGLTSKANVVSPIQRKTPASCNRWPPMLTASPTSGRLSFMTSLPSTCATSPCWKISSVA